MHFGFQDDPKSWVFCCDRYKHAILKSVHTVTGAYSEIFFITSYGNGVGRLIVDKYTKLLYSTHPDDIRMIMRRTDSGMTVGEAIDDILTSE